jgi:predicted ester cyclase
MKKIFLFLFAGVFFAFTACNNSVKVAGISNKDSIDKAQASAYSKAMQNKQLAMAAMEAFNKHDVNAGFKDCAADFLEYGDGSSKPMTLEPVKKFWNEVLVAFPDYKIDNIRYVAEGDWVVVWADCSGTWKGNFIKQTPNGKSFKIPDVDIFRFNGEGKIVEHHNIQSFDNIWRKVGIKM